MKTIISICIFVHILLSPRQSLAQFCSPNPTTETAKAFAKYCHLMDTAPSKIFSKVPDAEALRNRLEKGESPISCVLKKTVYECRGQVVGYSEPVRIYFKSDMKSPKGLNLHFHGHYDDAKGEKAWNYPFGATNGDYAQMLAQSKSQSILIIPESKGKVTTYKNDLGTGSLWSAWVRTLQDRMGVSSQLPISISGHSGADVVLNSIGNFCKTKEWDCAYLKSMGLFDSNYGKVQNGELIGRDGLKALAENIASRQGTIYVREAETSGLTSANNALVKNINKDRVNMHAVKTDHMSIMRDGGFSQFLEL